MEADWLQALIAMANEKDPIIVSQDGVTMAFPPGTSESDIIQALNVEVAQRKMGPAPVMPSSMQPTAPGPVNLGIGLMAQKALPSMAELGGAAAAILATGGRPRPGMPIPAAVAPTLSQIAQRSLAGAGGAAVTRGGIESLRPFMTGEQPQYAAMIPAAAQGATLGLPAPARSGFWPGLVGLGREAGQQGLAGFVGTTGEELAKGAPLEQAVKAGYAPAAIGAGAGAAFGILPTWGGQFLERSGEAIKNISAYVDAGIKRVTPAMAEPKRYSMEEAKRLRTGLVDAQGNETSQAWKSVYSDLDDGLTNLVGARPEGASLVETMRQRVMALPEAEKKAADATAELARATEQAAQAKKRVGDAETAYFSLRSKEAEQAHDVVVQEAQRVNDRAFEARMNSLIAEARLQAVGNITQGSKGLETPEVRQAFVERIVKPTIEAYKTYFADGYSLFPSGQKFDAKPIIAKLNEIKAKIGGDVSGLNKSEQDMLDKALAELTGAGKETEGLILSSRGKRIEPSEQTVTLEQLRNIRDNLFERGKLGEATDVNRKRLKELGHFISDEINGQAEAVYGKNLGAQLRGLNQDFKHYMDLQSVPGFDSVLFSTDATSGEVRSMVNGLLRDGPKSEAYAGVISFIENLATPKQGKQVIKTSAGPIIMPYSAVVAPELAAAFKGHFNSLINQNLIQRAVNNGQVDNVAFAKILSDVGNHEGLPALLGFAKGDIDNLVRVLKDFPEVGKVTADEMAAYMANPVIRKGLESQGTGLASVIQRDLADRAITDRMNRVALYEQARNVGAARMEYDKAIQTAKAYGITEGDARNKYMAALQNPALKPFGPNRSKGFEGELNIETYDTLKKSLFDPTAGATTNNYVENIFGYLKSSKDPVDQQLLRDLRASYIHDYLNLFQKEGAPGMVGELPSMRKFSEYFHPSGGSQAAQEMKRAQIVLEPAQYEQLQKLFAAGERLRGVQKYLPEQAGREEKGAMKEAAQTAWGATAGTLLRGVDGIQEAIRRGDYDNAMAALLNPEKYGNRLYYNGQWLVLGGRAAEAAPSGTYMEARRTQSVPPSVNQFINRYTPQAARPVPLR